MQHVFRKFRELPSCESGAAMVEAAIVIPLALIMLAGGVEITRGLAYHHAADKAVRDAARYIARLPTRDLANNPGRARNLVIYGTWTTALTSNAQSVLAPGTMGAGGFSLDETKLVDEGIVSIKASITYTFPLLSIIFSDATLVFTVQHEQPFIGG